jgi:hypothetical protein
MVSVRDAINRNNIYGFSVTTTGADLTAVITPTQISNAQASRINSLDFVLTGGPAYVFPDVGATDLVASVITATDTVVVVTDVTKFSVGDWLYVFLPADYTTWEIKRIKSIVAATSTLTVDSAFANTYPILGAPVIWIVGGKERFIPMTSGFSWGKEGLDWGSVYVRRMSAVNITLQGEAVLV